MHRGEKYPCDKCGKVLANKKMWRRHTSACVHGKKVACPDCGKQYASSQGMRQHHRAKHGVDTPELGMRVLSALSVTGCTGSIRVCLSTGQFV